MPPRASAAEKGKGKAPAPRTARGGAQGDEPQSARAERAAAPKSAADTTHRGGLRQAPRSEREAVEGSLLQLVLSGPFNQLDVELTLHILLSLDTRERLRCVSEVCKGWRSLRRHPALWRSVTLSHSAFSSASLVAFLAGPRSPLPSPACVETLELVGGRGAKAFNASSLKAALRTLSSATAITLSGKKLSKEGFAALAKPRAAPLRALKLGTMSAGFGTADALLALLPASPELTALEFDGLLTDAWLADAGARAVVPALVSLEVGERQLGFLSGVHVGAFCRLGAVFPQLATLRMEGLRGMDAEGGAPCTSLRAFAPLPALRSLHISGLCFPMHVRHLRDVEVQDFLTRLAAAAPSLRALHVSRGREMPADIFNAAAHVYAALPTLGSADLCGIGTLAQLEELELEYLGVTAADAAAAHLPSLTRLALDHCGPHAAAAASAIAAAAPRLAQLAVLGLLRTAHGGETGPAAAGFATLASASLTELRIGSSTHEMFWRGTTSVVEESNDGIGAALRDLAARNALPGLRTLAVDCDSGRMPSHTFQAAHPWPKLERLELPRVSADAAAVLAPLRAPLLTHLSMDRIVRGVAPAPGSARHQSGYASQASVAAYEALRTDGHAPLLPPLRYVSAAEAVAEPPQAQAADAGAADGSDSD